MASPKLNAVVWETNLPGIHFLNRGKVRDLYEVGGQLLLIATDRLSAFDVVLPTPIPDKGRVLTQLSLFWFNLLRDVIPNHIVTATDFPTELTSYRAQLEGRAMLCQRTNPLPIECVVRGYLSGSGWKDYRATGKICGIALPPGLRESERLPEAIFTPSTKATTGHDENISFDDAVSRIGGELALPGSLADGVGADRPEIRAAADELAVAKHDDATVAALHAVEHVDVNGIQPVLHRRRCSHA